MLQATPGDVARLGLALAPWPGLRAWAEAEGLDAVLLHRHWTLDRTDWPRHVGLLANHEPFDRTLGFGDNAALRDALGVTRDATLGERDGYPLGTVGRGPFRLARDVQRRLTEVFGGYDTAFAPADAAATGAACTGVAIARAMTPALLERAAALGANVYVTGQLRPHAVPTAAALGMHVYAVGHARSEHWMLRRLAALLTGASSGLQCVTPPAAA